MTTTVALILAAIAIAAVVLAVLGHFDKQKDDRNKRWEDAWRKR